MFPPAALSFEAMLEELATFDSLQRPELLAADIVLQSSNLEKLTPQILEERGVSGDVIRLALLAEGETTSELEQLLKFQKDFGNDPKLELRSAETRGKIADPSALKETLKQICKANKEFVLFFEPDLSGENWNTVIDQMADALTKTNEEFDRSILGLKIRCGGEGALPLSRIVEVILDVSSRAIPFKATAGLHHPLVEPQLNNELGFLNLLAAYLFLHAGMEFSATDIEDIFKTDDPSCYEFTNEQFRFHGMSLSINDVKRIRSEFVFRLGSCSLKEPDEDLVRLFGPPAETKK